MKTQNKISYLEFIAICGEYLIEPSIAMEDGCVADAVHNGDTEGLKQALEERF